MDGSRVAETTHAGFGANTMRMNIYVPDALRARMDRMSKKSKVSWSAIACRAFEAEIDKPKPSSLTVIRLTLMPRTEMGGSGLSDE
jgi:hypothetical protein